jgi:UDP-glucuronate 4-epimerase
MLERHIGRKAVTELAPLQPGDVVTTYADVDALDNDAGYRPSTTIEQGVEKFIEWYRDYYNHRSNACIISSYFESCVQGAAGVD